MDIAGVDIAPAVSAWFRENARELPWRAEGYPAWGILVSEIMLQQTPVVRVIPRLALWLERWPTPAHLAASPVGDAVRAWDRLGYPRRAMNLHAAAVVITERHGGIVPESVPELLALPGIGDYTARAVATFAFGHRHPVVDVNVRRVLARAVAGDGEPGPASARRDLPAMEAQLPEEPVAAAVVNAAVMELGATVCTARAPRCEVCPLADLCAWRAAGYPEFLGTRAPVQKKFAGSDRQVRGMILAELRASDIPVTALEISMVWADAVQRERSLASLLADGLVHTTVDGNYELPR
jgi:A/G-specific adenine glycosylase